MKDEVIDDTPGQLFLFGSDEDKKELNKEGQDPGNWMNELLGSNETDHPEPRRLCDPDKCEDDCSKCNIFRKPRKG